MHCARPRFVTVLSVLALTTICTISVDYSVCPCGGVSLVFREKKPKGGCFHRSCGKRRHICCAAAVQCTCVLLFGWELCRIILRAQHGLSINKGSLLSGEATMNGVMLDAEPTADCERSSRSTLWLRPYHLKCVFSSFVVLNQIAHDVQDAPDASNAEDAQETCLLW